jgi:L-lactate dehydrogenase (cytochrome)
MGKPITTVEDLRSLARKKVPKVFFDYVDSGSWTEATFRSNSADLAAMTFWPRVVRDLRSRSTQTVLAGQAASMPVAIAPTGSAGMQHADGEILAAQAAEAAGVPYTLSAVSICSIEDVARHTTRPFWSQIHFMEDKGFVDRLIDRAAAVACSALVVTLDIQVHAQRHSDIRNNRTAAMFTLARLPQFISRPGWCMQMLGTRRRNFGNIVGHVEGLTDVSGVANWAAHQLSSCIEWDDLRRVRDRWKGKLIVKGVTHPDDARAAVAIGADALVVSNHGGRQLDGALSTIRALPHVLAAVGPDTEVLMDGGIRSGQDVLKALAIGAKGVLIGRAHLYGLGAGGRKGVEKCLEIIRKELDLTMAMCGVSDIRQVSPAILAPRADSAGG